MRLVMRIVALGSVVLLGCSPPAGDPCADIDCGEFGQCRELGGAAVCECDSGYHHEGNRCVPNSDAAVPTCGNGAVEGGEACDGVDLRGETCVGLGFSGGTLDCRTDCTAFDTTDCDTTCGDGLRGGTEECDDEDLGGESCLGLGYYGGNLACDSGCTFDVSDCETAGRCGDDAVQGSAGEECDGPTLAGQTCVGLGFYGGTLSCDASCLFDTDGCSGRCGDNILQTAEEACDGPELGGETCGSQGFVSGVLGCTSGCAFDTSQCVGATCGSGTIDGIETCDDSNIQAGDGCDASCQVEAGYECTGEPSVCTLLCGNGQLDTGETCDGSAFGTATCQTYGFYTGSLSCTAACDQIVTNGCAGSCGDGVVNGPEVCDGSNIPGVSCADFGFHGGVMTCSGACDASNTSACVGSCGDGIRNGPEVCDGTDFVGGAACGDFGFYGGALTCAGTCDASSVSTCVGTCGDGIHNGPEVCDGTDFGAATCGDFGFYGGVLSCSGTCDASDQSACVGSCGDGVRNGPEVCDGNDFGAATCGDFGYYGGSLTCTGTCDASNTSACVGSCGDGIRNGPEVCDGTDFGAATCGDFGYYAGVLTCAGTCDGSDTSQCAGTCGDALVNGPEECDDGSQTAGDGCDAACLVEEGWGCGGEPSVCVPNPGAGEVIITEILYNPATPVDPGGEWFEVQNVGADAVNLMGCTITDGEGVAVIDASLVIEPSAFAVLAYADNSGTTGFTPDFVYGGLAGNFQLANTSDQVTITCPDGAGGDVTVDEVLYTTSSPFPSSVNGTAIALDVLVGDATNNDRGGYWCHATSAIGGGDLGTPGQANALCDDTVDWCRLQWPASVSVAPGAPFTVYARVYEADVTDLSTLNDPSPVLLSEFGYALDGSDPVADATAWTWTSGTPNSGWDGAASGEPNNDEYQADLSIGVAGTWDFAARFSRDGGATWLYCDLDDSSNGYQSVQSGDASVF